MKKITFNKEDELLYGLDDELGYRLDNELGDEFWLWIGLGDELNWNLERPIRIIS